MWTKFTDGPVALLTDSTMSFTGPHVRLSQKRGVPMMSTVGFPFFNAASSESACMEQMGLLVQIGFTPRGADGVGVATEIARSPGIGAMPLRPTPSVVPPRSVTEAGWDAPPMT